MKEPHSNEKKTSLTFITINIISQTKFKSTKENIHASAPDPGVPA